LSPSSRAAKPKPVPPWRRVEAGQYRSSDDRFTIGSEGPSRWFVTDDEEHDDFGLALTLGPFGTLDAAKEAADEHRSAAPPSSPLAERVTGAGESRSPAAPQAAQDGVRRRRSKATREAPSPEAEPEPPPPPPPPKKTWLELLAEDDRAAARRARDLIAALEDAGIDDADALVRRDVVGNQPVVAARLLAGEIIDAVSEATEPRALDRLLKRLPATQRETARPGVAATSAIEAVLDVLGGSRPRRDLPGWRLVERDGPEGEPREIRVTPADLRDAREPVEG
jgi:hypothetical protein